MVDQYQVLARRYRPQQFAEVVGQIAIIETLKNAIRRGLVAHAYLFCGSRGIGKTTLARLFAKALNCQALTKEGEPCGECVSCKAVVTGQSLDVIEIDGASHRGIEDIRQINETVGYAPAHGRYKIYIIDEVHMLTKEAFNALLKTLEEPPGRAKFFLATTEPHKVLATIVSRCQRFDLARLTGAEIEGQLKKILIDLNRRATKEALHLISSFVEGSLRDAELLLDQILCYTPEDVEERHVRQVLGLASREVFAELDRAFVEGNSSYAFTLVGELFQSGKSLGHFFEELVEHYRTHLIAQPSKVYSTHQALYILDYLVNSADRFSKSAYPRVSLEILLSHILRSKHRVPLDVLVRRLVELEGKIKNKEEALPVALEPMKAPEEALKPVPFAPIAPPPSEPKVLEKHPSHYETLLRFAAVELEGRPTTSL